MTTQQRDSADENIKRLVREAASEYGHAVTRYGNALTAYGSGEIDAAKVAETSINIAVVQARKFTELGIHLSMEYAKRSAAFFGVTFPNVESAFTAPSGKSRSKK
jgi:hypothetical protein